MEEDVQKFLRTDVIAEMQYPTWLCNPVMVRKPNDSWRMCQDFKDLNKHCPKHCFQLALMERLIDATSGHQLMDFLDAYAGYHQIFMHPTDAEKTAFLTPSGVYYYKRMPFGLKSVGSAYQRLVTRVFRPQNLEAYIDDMVIKSK